MQHFQEGGRFWAISGKLQLKARLMFTFHTGTDCTQSDLIKGSDHHVLTYNFWCFQTTENCGKFMMVNTFCHMFCVMLVR